MTKTLEERLTIGLVGLGLMGGSAAKALKTKTPHRVLAFDLDPDTLARALADGSADGLLKDEEIYSIFDTRKILKSPPRVGISRNSGAAGIAVWLSQKLGKPVAKTEPIVHALKDWVDAQYEGGRVTNIGDGELWDVYQMQMEA